MQASLTSKYREILQYIGRKKSATVAELTSMFFLSESTVRRLLAEMERNELIVRYHGGAVIAGEPVFDKRIGIREVQDIREKAAIGREAASLVQDGMTLLMLGGTTVLAVCPYIRNKSVTIITSSLPVVNELLNEPGMKLILLGGALNPGELEVRGSMTALGMDRLRADLLFMGATNIHPVHGVMTDDIEAVATYRACLAASDKKVLLADSTKFRSGGITVVAGLNELDTVITDEKLSVEAKNMIQEKGIDLTVAGLEHGVTALNA
jgi:DeoR/GlpR family transcriptional regulator of sugar metabolism